MGLFSKNVPITKINSFKYSYSRGYAINAYIIYSLKNENGKFIASFKPYGIADEDALIKEVDSTFEEKLEIILKEFKVGKWNGFKKSNKMVLDGDSFDLAIWMEGETSIHASRIHEMANELYRI